MTPNKAQLLLRSKHWDLTGQEYRQLLEKELANREDKEAYLDLLDERIKFYLGQNPKQTPAMVKALEKLVINEEYRRKKAAGNPN